MTKGEPSSAACTSILYFRPGPDKRISSGSNGLLVPSMHTEILLLPRSTCAHGAQWSFFVAALCLIQLQSISELMGSLDDTTLSRSACILFPDIASIVAPNLNLLRRGRLRYILH